MTTKFTRKLKRTVKRWRKNRSLMLAVSILVLCVGTIGYANYMENKRMAINPESYRPLLSLIGRAESNDNYNAYFNNPGNSQIDFTNMTIRQVQEWQAEYLRQGSPSSAVGRYQIVDTTLAGLVKRLGVDPAQKFNAAMQDRLAIALLERRGSEKYVNKELTREEFAANLAMEWAALPKVIGENPHDSYYAGDGLNRSRVKPDEVLSKIDAITTR